MGQAVSGYVFLLICQLEHFSWQDSRRGNWCPPISASFFSQETMWGRVWTQQPGPHQVEVCVEGVVNGTVLVRLHIP